MEHPGHVLKKEDITADGVRWYNVSEPILRKQSDGDLYSPEDATHYIVRRGRYHIVEEWDYMDIIWVSKDLKLEYTCEVCRCTCKEPPHKISERRFNNLVARLKDPNVSMDRIRKTYL